MIRSVACMALLITSFVHAQGTKEDYERAGALYARTRNKVFRDKVTPNWFDGGRRFWYRVDLPGQAREWILVDAQVGKRELAFPHDKLAEALAKQTNVKVRGRHLPLEQVRFAEDASILYFTAMEKRWRYDRRKNELSEEKRESVQEEVAVQQKRPRPRPKAGSSLRSPDGSWEVFFKEHNLYLKNRKTGQDSRLTGDGNAADGYGGRVYWAPDSKKFVVLRTRAASVRQIHFIESSPRDQVQPKLHSLNYPKPGDELPISKPQLFEVETGKQVRIKDDLFAQPWSLSQFRWERDSSRFTFVYNQRGHQVLRVLGVDLAGKVEPIVEERSKTFIDYAHKMYLYWMESRRELIWMSERDGWNHLYLYDAQSGKLKNQITRGAWVVRGIDRVDEKTRQIWFRLSGYYADQDPYYIHHARVNLDGTGLVLLTEGEGTHEIRYSPDQKYLLDSYSRVDLAPITELRRVEDGRLLCTLEKGDMTALVGTGWRAPERFVAKGRDGQTDIHGILCRPTNFDPRKSYPVIEYIYAGPQGSFVPKAFRPFHSLQAMAELGFIVVQIDGMGTSNRSKAFHDVCWKNLGDAGFPDRILWIKAAAQKYPYMDLRRVGIYGGSAGGQSSTRALLAYGDFYKVAVSDCGCHDNRVDKIWWNELWMGYPIGPHYAEQSNANPALARKLTGKLLLIVGEVDRNVDPASTMQVVHALVRANKDFDLLVLPGVGHGAAETPYGQRRRQDFFVRHLLGVEPRREPKGKE